MVEKKEVSPAQSEELRFLKKLLDDAMEDYFKDPSLSTEASFRRAKEDVQMYVFKLRSKGVDI
tara:strand:+ start:474 stop:662 length:189 start_codon:yes stop_codon:yes gene_type:complete